MNALSLLFSLDPNLPNSQVTRKQYLAWGFGLMALKYLGQCAASLILSGQVLPVYTFLLPFITTRNAHFAGAAEWYLVFELLWSIPFLWIGLVLSFKRAIDAGRSPWLALLFVFPFVNFILIATLAATPSRRAQTANQEPKHPLKLRVVSPDTADTTAANSGTAAILNVVFLSLLLSTAISVFGLLVTVYLGSKYGTVLFIGTPVTIATITSWLWRSKLQVSLRQCTQISITANAVAAGILLLFAFEGVLCITMAIPLALIGAVIGAILGYSLANVAPIMQRSSARSFYDGSLVIAAIILAALSEGALTPPLTELRRVSTSIEISAIPEQVWKNVVEFSELPPPSGLLFKLGVAHPVRARIEGSGIGAIRYCEFSTGPFVEPITHWEAPTRLAFAVTSQPPTMHELSPYGQISPPHLDTIFKSSKGEFLLEEISPGRTRLTGSTWYSLDIKPTSYWALWSDYFVHSIHTQVLEHIRRESEGKTDKS